jgi:hypothetical protein
VLQLRAEFGRCEAATDDHRRLIETSQRHTSKSWPKEDAMPYEKENERVADVDGESLLCWVSEANLRPETTIDLHTGCFEAMPLSELWS